MSIEEKLAALTAAIEANTEALLASSEDGTTKSAAKAPAKAAAKPAAKAPAKAAAKKPAAKKTTKKVTVDDVKAGFGAILSLTEDEEEEAGLVEMLGPLLEHLGVTRISLIDEDQIPEAMNFLEGMQACYEEEGMEGLLGYQFPFMEEGGDDAGGKADVL